MDRIKRHWRSFSGGRRAICAGSQVLSGLEHKHRFVHVTSLSCSWL
jgi:hypothetical protein